MGEPGAGGIHFVGGDRVFGAGEEELLGYFHSGLVHDGGVYHLFVHSARGNEFVSQSFLWHRVYVCICGDGMVSDVEKKGV